MWTSWFQGCSSPGRCHLESGLSSAVQPKRVGSSFQFKVFDEVVWGQVEKLMACVAADVFACWVIGPPPTLSEVDVNGPVAPPVSRETGLFGCGIKCCPMRSGDPNIKRYTSNVLASFCSTDGFVLFF